jgi:tetratricopeptide (TPR) repeat protein
MELKSHGDPEGAWQNLELLIANHPDYVASYSPAGEVLTELGRFDEAQVVYDKGIAACARGNDAHTREHLESALATLGDRK